jgi:hypothetical protein
MNTLAGSQFPGSLPHGLTSSPGICLQIGDLLLTFFWIATVKPARGVKRTDIQSMGTTEVDGPHNFLIVGHRINDFVAKQA